MPASRTDVVQGTMAPTGLDQNKFQSINISGTYGGDFNSREDSQVLKNRSQSMNGPLIGLENLQPTNIRVQDNGYDVPHEAGLRN